jgi:hypothetical protein
MTIKTDLQKIIKQENRVSNFFIVAIIIGLLFMFYFMFTEQVVKGNNDTPAKQLQEIKSDHMKE